MRKQNGFSLIELLIVVAIILIIAAIAIPNLLRARMAANEASAVGSIRTIITGEITYASTYSEVGYAYTLASLGGAAPCMPSSTTACVIDDFIAAGKKDGYKLTAVGAGGTGSATAPTSPNLTFLTTAVPYVEGLTGTRGFCGDQAGVIYFNTDGSVILTNAACVALIPPQ